MAQDPYIQLQRAMERALLRQYVPPWIVVNEAGDIGNFDGNVAPFIAPIDKVGSHNVFQLAEAYLQHPLGVVIERMRDKAYVWPAEGLRVTVPDAPMSLELNVLPVEGKERATRWYCIVFESMATDPFVRNRLPAQIPQTVTGCCA
ncbi:MAG TPA: hypothetical protein VGM97_16065 [Steroidobacteraceae bacterium]|jgi:hypothetical protein